MFKVENDVTRCLGLSGEEWCSEVINVQIKKINIYKNKKEREREREIKKRKNEKEWSSEVITCSFV